MDLIITVLPVVTEDLPISPRFTPYDFLSRCKFSNLTTRQPMVEFYLLTFPRFPFRKKEHKSYFGKNRTHDFRTSRCAGYLLDHSGDEGILSTVYCILYTVYCILYTVCSENNSRGGGIREIDRPSRRLDFFICRIIFSLFCFSLFVIALII